MKELRTLKGENVKDTTPSRSKVGSSTGDLLKVVSLKNHKPNVSSKWERRSTAGSV